MTDIATELLQNHLPDIANADFCIKAIIYGYIRQDKINVPGPIIDMILLYYYNKYTLFHPSKIHETLRLIEEGRSVVTANRDARVIRRVALGRSISNELWNKFIIHIQWKNIVSGTCFACYLGDCETLDLHGRFRNVILISAYPGKTRFGGFVHWRTPSSSGFQNEDIFSFCIDFVKDSFGVYYNGNYVGCKSLRDNKVVTLYLSFSYHPNQKITILDRYPMNQ